MSSVVISGDTSGSVTLTVPAIAGSNTVTIPAGTGTAAVQGVSTNIVSGTAQNSTSGTAILFTNIPSWAKRITVIFQGVKQSGTSYMLIQIGTSGGVVSSGYLGSSAAISTTSVATSSTAGFVVYTASSANVIHGKLTIQNINSNSWVSSGTLALSDGTYVIPSAGSVSLSGALTQINITHVTGTDTFTAGTINIFWE